MSFKNKDCQTEIDVIALCINKYIEQYQNDKNELNDLCLIAIFCLNASESRINGLKEQGPIKKFWKRITGKNNKIKDTITNDLLLSQKAAQYLLSTLLERNLITFNTIAAINNKLNNTIKSFYKETISLYTSNNDFIKKITDKYNKLTNSISDLQRNQELFSWSHTIKFQKYNGIDYNKLPKIFKMHLIIADFCSKTKYHILPDELILLKTTIDAIGLDNDSDITVIDYIRSCTENFEVVELILTREIKSILYKLETFEIPVVKSLNKIIELASCNNEDIIDQVLEYINLNSLINLDQKYSLFDFVLNIIFSIKNVSKKLNELLKLSSDIKANKIISEDQVSFISNIELDDLNYLIENGISPNSKINDVSILFKINSNKIIKYLIEAGADINSQDDSGFSLLHHSTLVQDFEFINYLIENGINLNIKDHGGNIALYYALLDSDGINIIKLLINKGSDLSNVNNIGENLIHCAALVNENSTIINTLIDKGVPVNVTTRSKLNPIHCAALSNENPEIIKILIEQGVNINSKDLYDVQPIHLAAKNNNNPEIITTLISIGADVHASTNSSEQPIHFAARYSNNPEIIKTLISIGVDVHASTNSSEQPIHFAAKNENIDILKVFVDSGGNINCKDKLGNLPLHKAVYNDNHKIIEYLIECGADVNCKNYSNESPIEIAFFYSKKPRNVKTLIENGAYPIYQ